MILLFLIIGLLPVALLGYLNYHYAYKVIERQARDQLISLREDRKEHIEKFFRNLRLDVEILSDHRLLKDILTEYITAYKKGGLDGEEFKAVDSRYHRRYAGLCKRYGYEDMLFVDNEGNVLITAKKNPDWGANLITGIYSDTNLAECFKNAKRGISIVDFKEYPPSGKPAAFIGAPMISHGARKGFKVREKIGVLIIQIPVDHINAILQREEGLGETGEIYLIERDMLMRSDSRFLKESSILKVKVGKEVVREVLKGKPGFREKMIDYRGEPVSIAFGPVQIKGLDWFIMAKKDLDEIMKPIRLLRNQSLAIGLLVAMGVVLAELLFVTGIIKPIRRMRDATHRIASGDLSIRIPVETKGEIGELSNSINLMAQSLIESREKIEEYSRSLERKVELRTELLNKRNQALEESNNIQRAHNEIVTVLNNELEIEPLLKNIIGKIASYTDSQLGVIYLYENEGENLFPVSSYAIDREILGDGFRLGQGLPGQTALERRVLLVTDVPENYFRISSGGIEGVPKNVICMPITIKDQLVGVLELASLHDYADRNLEFLNMVTYQLGIGINNALTYQRLDEMAADLKEKNELLAAQNEELQAQSEELQAQAEELMAQKNALEEKTKQVREADRLKSEFVSNMSHELRTPLNAILGLTSLMAEGSAGHVNKKQKEYLEIIERNGKNLLQLINDVLDLSRIESGKVELTISKIRLKEFVKGISRTILPLVEEKGLNLNIDIDDDIYIYNDGEKLRQILVNLLGNAAKFTERGKIDISARVEENRLHDWIIIKVSDTGIGIPPEALEHIFEPFRQVNGSLTRKYGGTGLGLNICYKLTSIMGGKIEVESEPGEGSTFTVKLKKDRRSKLRPKEEEWQKKVRTVLLQETEAGEKELYTEDKEIKRILIIDDDPIVIRELKIIFKKENYRLAFALTGSGGLQRIKEETPDLVLLDLHMPKIDGFQVLEELQKREDLKDLPVIVITAADLAEDEKRGLPKNVKDMIVKGQIDKSSLLAKINVVLQGESRTSGMTSGMDEQTAQRMVGKIKRKAEGGGLVKILIAEDRIDNMILIKETLRSTGYAVYTASNGQEALEMAKKESPDLILMDMQMPVMNGFEATKHIRKIEDLKNIPVIALTARAMKGDEEKTLAAGCTDYLSKPVMPKDLIKKVEEWLRKGESGKHKRDE